MKQNTFHFFIYEVILNLSVVKQRQLQSHKHSGRLIALDKSDDIFYMNNKRNMSD